MPNENVNDKYSITIEFEDFLTRYDINEVISFIDKIIEDEIIKIIINSKVFYKNLGPFYYSRKSKPEFSFLGIKSVSSGSIVLIVTFSGAVLLYVTKNFKKGIDKSILAETIIQSGMLAGDLIGGILERMNEPLERFVANKLKKGSNLRKIKTKKVSSTVSEEKIEQD